MEAMSFIAPNNALTTGQQRRAGILRDKYSEGESDTIDFGDYKVLSRW